MFINPRHNTIAAATTFVWIGFVCAISFMEAWLKFQAPGIDTRLGVGIGKLIFAALNKVEIVSLVLIIVCTMVNKRRDDVITILLVLLSTILLIQTLWLLPQLSKQADLLINYRTVERSNHHVHYVLMEVLKLLVLFILGSRLLRTKYRKYR